MHGFTKVKKSSLKELYLPILTDVWQSFGVICLIGIRGLLMADTAVVRAMLIGMMSKSQVDALHDRERQLGRCLASFEAVGLLGLDEIKTFYGIPGESPSGISKHNSRIQAELTRCGCFVDMERSMIETNVSDCHVFDQNVMIENGKGNLKLEYQGGKGSAKAIAEELTQ